MSPNSERPSAVVTGASSGLGLAITRALLAEGYRVTALCRSRPPLEDPALTHQPIDLTVEGALDDIFAQFEDLPPDLWVNNAGFGLLGGFESPAVVELKRLKRLLLEVPQEVARWYAGVLRRQKPPPEACLVQVSSLAAELPIPWMPHYNAAKAGLSAFCASLLLDGELPFRLIDFRPGDFATPFVDQPGMVPASDLRQYHARLAHHHRVAPPPERAARDLIRALRKRHHGILRSGEFFQRRIAPLGPRLLPQCLLHRLIRRYYGL